MEQTQPTNLCPQWRLGLERDRASIVIERPTDLSRLSRCVRQEMIGVSAVDARDRCPAGLGPEVLVAYQVLDVSGGAPLDIGAYAVGLGGVTVLRRVGKAYGLGTERGEILL